MFAFKWLIFIAPPHPVWRYQWIIHNVFAHFSLTWRQYAYRIDRRKYQIKATKTWMNSKRKKSSSSSSSLIAIFFSHLRLWIFFASLFPLASNLYIRNVCGEVNEKGIERRNGAIAKINFGIWCVSHKAIYCNLIDFLCGKQLKRNSDVHDWELIRRVISIDCLVLLSLAHVSHSLPMDTGLAYGFDWIH